MTPQATHASLHLPLSNFSTDEAALLSSGIPRTGNLPLVTSTQVDGTTRANLEAVNDDSENPTSEWRTVNDRTRNRRRKRTNRYVRQILRFEDLFKPEEPHFNRYFTIRFPGLNISTDVNILRMSADIRRETGKLSKITKANRSSLLVEVESPNQATKLKSIKTLAGHPVIVEAHRSFNQIKGVVRSKAFSHNTEAELQDHLSEQGVGEVRRIKLKRDGEEKNTDTYILSFNLRTLPKVITLDGWYHEPVEEYTNMAMV